MGDMAIQSLLTMATPHLDTMARGLLTLNLRQMLDTMEGMDIVAMATVVMVVMDMDVDSTVVAFMERDLLIPKLMLDTMEGTTAVATVDMVAMDLAMAVVISLVKLLYQPAVYIQFPLKYKVGRNCNNKYLQF